MGTKKFYALIILLLFITFLIAGEVVSIKSILDNPQKFDGKVVTVKGEVNSLKFKVSKRGNPYFTFKVDDGEAEIMVFSYGKPWIDNGQKVKVTGVFNAVKRVGQYTFYNEIDASRGSIE